MTCDSLSNKHMHNVISLNSTNYGFLAFESQNLTYTNAHFDEDNSLVVDNTIAWPLSYPEVNWTQCSNMLKVNSKNLLGVNISLILTICVPKASTQYTHDTLNFVLIDNDAGYG